MEPVRFGPFELDIRERELRSGGQRLRLQGKPFDLLAALVAQPGELIARDELRRRLWSDETFVAFDENLNAAVRKLRRTLNDSASAPTYIETVAGHGYRFIAPVERSEVHAPAPALHSLDAGPGHAPQPVARSPSMPRAAVLAFTVTTALAALAIGIIRSQRGEPAVTPEFIQLQIAPSPGSFYPSGAPRAAVSPDGGRIAFLAVTEAEGRAIWIQSLNERLPQRVPGTEHAWEPFWSPDGEEIAFVALSKLHRLNMVQRRLTTLGEANASGGAWSRRGGILVYRDSVKGIVRIAPGTGRWDQVTRVDPSQGEKAHFWPQFLPDGESFIYLALCERPEQSGVYLARLGREGRRRLIDTPFKALYAPPGLLLFVRGNRLYAQRLDVGGARLSGEMHEVATDIPVVAANGGAAYSVSAAGVLVRALPYRHAQRQFVWLNRYGQHLEHVGRPGPLVTFALSPDERTVLIQAPDLTNDSADLWALDFKSGNRHRLVDGAGNDEAPVWGPGAGQFTYARHRAIHENADVHVAAFEGSAPHRPLVVDAVESTHPSDWSPDRKYLLYETEDRGAGRDIWVTPADGSAPAHWLATRYDERSPRFSPNALWVAYESNETGRREVYVRTFHPPHTVWRVSTDGGSQPRWRGDGRELFYLGADFRLMSVRVTDVRGFEAGAPAPLFEVRRLAAAPNTLTPYAVSSDGQRFLVALVTDEGGDSPMQVMLNWTSRVFTAGRGASSRTSN